MTAVCTMKLEGVEDLTRRLEMFADDVQRTAMKRATRAAAALVQQRVKEATPVGHTGNLKKSITRRSVTYKNTGTFVVVPGFRYPIGAHAHLVEMGTKPRYRFAGRAARLAAKGQMMRARYLRDTRKGSRGGYTGLVVAKPFMGPAFREAERPALERLAKVLTHELDKAAGRVAK